MAALHTKGNSWKSHEAVGECCYKSDPRLKAGICKKTYQHLQWHPQGVATVVLGPVNSSCGPLSALPPVD